MANFLSKIFNEDARKIKQIEKRIQPVLDKEEEYKNKGNDTCTQRKTCQWRNIR